MFKPNNTISKTSINHSGTRYSMGCFTHVSSCYHNLIIYNMIILLKIILAKQLPITIIALESCP